MDQTNVGCFKNCDLARSTLMLNFLMLHGQLLSHPVLRLKCHFMYCYAIVPCAKMSRVIKISNVLKDMLSKFCFGA